MAIDEEATNKEMTDEEIIHFWSSFSKNMKPAEAVVSLYHHAENAGRQAGISAVEKELLSDSTIEEALQSFGLGRKKKASTITTRAIMREAFRLAKEKTKNRN